MLTSKVRTMLAALAFSTFTLGATASFADEVKVPQTAADHETLAKQYRDEAAQYKKVADEHRAMAAAYAKGHPDPKGGGKNAWNEKMQTHCKALAADADKLASDAEKAADFHTMRAKELQGK
jgi:outer membrane murein-binding lipoprotein Lpp